MPTPLLQTALTKIYLPGTAITLAQCSTVLKNTAENILIELRVPCSRTEELREQLLKSLYEETPNIEASISVRIEQFKIANANKSPSSKIPPPKALPQVKNVIAVASGKGGVGKSTTAINLALSLQKEGAKVGVLDADIFGPSQSILSGMPINTRPETIEQKFFVPIKAHGLQMMSMGFLITEQTPAVWRGPMASGALQQMLTQTAWEDLDYLIVDMPPGTGDIQLTLSQSCPLTAAIIITTPQDIALLDAVKGIEMFRKVNVPILGVVENMSTHICSNCGHAEPIFGEGGGEKVARDYQVPLLGRLPLDISIRRHADEGRPSVLADPQSAIALIYREIALKMAAELCKLEVERSIPNIVSIR